ncbi:MAG: patatin [Proteobacteria bacterium]|nr:MAG: patatin [Pseudomonadota bacterium]
MKIGLALGSGAARGAAHIGVIKALERLGLKPDIVCGCSIGAMIGAAYVNGNLERLEHWFGKLTRLEMLRYFEVNFAGSGIVKAETFSEFLAGEICDPDLDMEALDTKFASVATEIRSGKEVWLQRGNLLDAVRASIALPGLFRPVALDGGWLVDGGLVNPVPVSICRSLGADLVIAVNLNTDIVGKHFIERENAADADMVAHWRQRFSAYSNSWLGGLFEKNHAPGLFDTLASSFNIMQDRITRSRMAGDPPDVTLSPRLSHIGLLEFYRASAAMAEGEATVKRMATEIEYVVAQRLAVEG